MKASDTIVLSLVVVFIFAALGATGWLFLLKKNYHFVVEAPCDPEKEVCFYRDCTDPNEYCPPNELEEYRVFVISAKDFSQCSDNSCLNECELGTIQCEEVVCGDSEEDQCTKQETNIPDTPVESQ